MKRRTGPKRQSLSLPVDAELFSISQVNQLPRSQMLAAYRQLVPFEILPFYGIDPDTLADSQGRMLFACETAPSSVELSLRHTWDAEDPMLYLQLADTSTNQIEVLLFVVNNPHGERFNIDRLPDGTPTHFGTQGRNVPEEIRAMEVGLAPGQVRRGLRLARQLVPTLEQFVTALHHDVFFLQPLAYHNAILFERLGFGYTFGLGRMEWIDKEFRPGGLLHERLDGSTPFRKPGAASSVRGRSWAIHDGILGEPYAGVKMYRRVGIHAGIITFSHAPW